jgi:hypothetical protein
MCENDEVTLKMKYLSISVCSLNLGIAWRQMPSAVFCVGISPSTYQTGNRLGPRSGLDSDEDKRKISDPARNLTIFYVHSAFSIGSVKPELSRFHK